jgi:hypothetical protein
MSGAAGEKRKAKRPINLSIVPPPRSRNLKPVFEIPLVGSKKNDNGASAKVLLQPPDNSARKRTRSAPGLFGSQKEGRTPEIFSPPPRRAPSQEVVSGLRIEVPQAEVSSSDSDSTPSTATLCSEAKTPQVQEIPLPMKALLRDKMRPSSVGQHEEMFRVMRHETVVIF